MFERVKNSILRDLQTAAESKYTDGPRDALVTNYLLVEVCERLEARQIPSQVTMPIQTCPKCSAFYVGEHICFPVQPTYHHLQEGQHTGIMIAFFVDPDVAKQLALPGGEDASELHVTLLYVGDKADFTGDIEQLKTLIADFAAKQSPLEAKIGGIGRFLPSDSSENLSPVIALVNAFGLQSVHEYLQHIVHASGGFYADDFGDYLPHITLAYIDPQSPMPVQNIEPLPFSFGTLWLCIGDERIPYKLGQGEPQPTKAESFSDGPYSYKVEYVMQGNDRIAVKNAAMGRAHSKTQQSAEWVIEKAKQQPGCTLALMGTRAIAESILAHSPPDFKPDWNRATLILTWPNGSRAMIYSPGDNPDYMRGTHHDEVVDCSPEEFIDDVFRHYGELNNEPTNTQGSTSEQDSATTTHEEESGGTIGEIHEGDRISGSDDRSESDTSTGNNTTNVSYDKVALAAAMTNFIKDFHNTPSVDRDHLSNAIATAYLDAQHSAYRKAMQAVGIKVAQEGIIGRVASGIKTTFDQALSWAKEQVQSIVGTLQDALDNFMGDLGPDLSSGDIDSEVSTFLQEYASWKAPQVANYTYGSGLEAGTKQALADIMEEVTSADTTLVASTIRVRVLPEDSSSDECKKYAGNDYSLDEYQALGVSWPAHVNCPHYSEIYVVGG